MANIKSAKKRIKVSKRNELRNRQFKSIIKTAIKKIALFEGEEKEQALRKAISYLDKAVNKGILKVNTAARKKSLIVKNASKEYVA